jgi:hypothetical protein
VDGFWEVLCEIFAFGNSFFCQKRVWNVLVFAGGFELMVALAVAEEVDAWSHILNDG